MTYPVAIETAMAALFAHISAAVQIGFTADAQANSAVLSSVPAALFDQLVEGIPVFGPGVERGAVIAAMDPQAQTITLSLPVSADAAAAPFNTGFLTTGRRVKHWTDVPAQPAFFLRRVGMIDDADHNSGFVRTTLDCEAWIYCNAGENPNAIPDQALACLEELIRRSMAPDGDYGDMLFTLGGLVYWCRIEGHSDISSGDQDGQAIARLSVRVTLP